MIYEILASARTADIPRFRAAIYEWDTGTATDAEPQQILQHVRAQDEKSAI